MAHLVSRVVVVGAGHNGLVAAIRLARAGLPVVVLEQAARPGGGVTSTAGPFVHDVCSGFFPLARAAPALRDLPLERHGVEWIAPEVAMVHPFLEGGEIALHRDLAATAASLDAAVPGAGAAWTALAAPPLAQGRRLADAALSRFPPLRAGTGVLVRMRREALELVRRGLLSAAALGAELGDESRVGGWLAGTTMHSDLTPDDSGGAGFALLLHLLGHLVGWPIVRGGAQQLTDALVAHLEELGGEVRCGVAVTAIQSGGRVRGVVAGGERIGADAVVSTLSAGALAPLLGDALPARLMARLRGWRYGLGTFKADFELAGPVPWTSEPARRATVVHVGDTLEAMRRTPPLICGQQSLHDPSRAPAGKHTLYAYFRSAQRVEDADAVGDAMEERIEAFAPGFRRLVEARVLRPPQQLAVENPSLIGGDLAGGSCRLDQQLIFRPAPELFRYRSPLRGLYVAGPSTHPGPGVHGTSGAGAADALLADRRRRRL